MVKGCAVVPHLRIGRLLAATTFPFFNNFPFHLSHLRSGLVRGRFVGVFGWLEPPTNPLIFVSKNWPSQCTTRSSPAANVWWASGLGISSSSSLYQLPYSWGRLFKILLFEEPLPRPNRMANSI
uniref:Uncharacterized protein n=1 Tax=Fagus sylvatica TaxID=28930 RepID=A0A2N9IYR4_FAGSY